MGKLKLFHGKNRGEFAMTQFFAQIESKGSISWWLDNGVKILLKSQYDSNTLLHFSKHTYSFQSLKE